MANILQHQSINSTKLLLIGDSGAGKTGALAALAGAGYKLRILDLDNGLDILRNYLSHPASPYLKARPDAATLVEYETLTEKMKVTAGGHGIPTTANVWPRMLELLSSWKTKDADLGPVSEWGSDIVLAIDSLSFVAQAALNFHLSINGALGKSRTQNEARRDIYAAQNYIRNEFMPLIFSDHIKCNVIVTAHVTFVTEGGERPGGDDGTDKSPGSGYPSAVGRALSPHIPRWFNSMLIARTSGSGSMVKNKLYSRAQSFGGQLVNAKSSAPLSVKSEYDIAWGLAEYIAHVQGREFKVPTPAGDSK